MLIGAGALGLAYWKHFDGKTIGLLLAAICLYYFQFYHSTPDQFTLDAQTHIDYVSHIAHYGRIPEPEDDIVAARHPPTYYTIAAGFYWLGEQIQGEDPVMLARQFSMICYIGFIFFSIHLLRLMLIPDSGSYYAALGLLLFWPIGVTIGGRITCDPLLFAAETGVLYYFARWLKDKQFGDLSSGFFCSALSIGAKNGGIIMFFLGLMVLLSAMITYRRSLRVFLRWDLFLSIACALLVYVLTQKHGWVTQNTAVDTGRYEWLTWWNRISTFSVFLLLYETSLGLTHDMFWNMCLHTLLLGDDTMPWRSVDLMIVFQILWMALLLYLILGFFKLKALLQWERQVFALMLGFVMAILASMIFMLLATGNYGYGDARYAYPCVAIIALWHGKIMDVYRASGPASICRMGVWLSCAFVGMTFLLFITQYYGPVL